MKIALPQLILQEVACVQKEDENKKDTHSSPKKQRKIKEKKPKDPKEVVDQDQAPLPQPSSESVRPTKPLHIPIQCIHDRIDIGAG